MTIWKIQFKDVVLAEYVILTNSTEKQVEVPSSVVDKIDASKKILYLKVLPYLIFKNPLMVHIVFYWSSPIEPSYGRPKTILWESDQALVDRVLAKILDR